MSAELVELGRRAVACKGWRWMPGMLAIQYRSEDPPVRLVYVDDDGFILWHADINDKPRNFYTYVVDVTDPATLGCLLALVREAWSHPDLHIRREADGWRNWTDKPGAFLYDNEAEALVCALEAAP